MMNFLFKKRYNRFECYAIAIGGVFLSHGAIMIAVLILIFAALFSFYVEAKYEESIDKG